MNPSERLSMPDAEVTFYPDFFGADERGKLFQDLVDTIQWKQESARFGGKAVPLPRLTAWYGDAGKTYRYSGITVEPIPWTPLLLTIKTRVESAANTTFNSVLLNFYRGERDSVAWHSDDEPELGKNPVIASVSFGATRKFQFKHKTNPDLRTAVDLTPGSLLLMAGTTQHFWKHQIPKTTKPTSARINLTFRVITG
ncbi:MAG: alpha-ketoglutarate-dependent dioxygenase AlkB [Chloroflexota bacterium]